MSVSNAALSDVKNVLLRMSVQLVWMIFGPTSSMESVCVGGLKMKSPTPMGFVHIVMSMAALLVLLTIIINATSAMTPKHRSWMGSVCALMAKS